MRLAGIAVVLSAAPALYILRDDLPFKRPVEVQAAEAEVLIPDDPKSYMFAVIDTAGLGAPVTPDKFGRKVYFDMDADQFAETSDWPLSGYYFIARDHDGDGAVKNAGDLVGDFEGTMAENIRVLDDSGDGVIDAADASWARWMLLSDGNNDGFFNDTEIMTPAMQIRQLRLNLPDAVVAGDVLGEAESLSGARWPVYAVQLSFDQTNSVSMKEYKLDPRVLFLPTLRGFGNVPYLYQAMSESAALMDAMVALAQRDKEGLWFDCDATSAMVENILYMWAGVDKVAPDSRGPNIDARKLEFLETFLGNKFVQKNRWRDPMPQAAALIVESWDQAYVNMRAHLLAQVPATKALHGGMRYDPHAGTIRDTGAGFDEEAIAALNSEFDQRPDAQACKAVFAQHVDVIRRYAK